MTPERTPEGKWMLYRVTDGQRFDRWSVDAQQMLATGGYTADPPNGDDRPTATVAPGTAIDHPTPDTPEPPAVAEATVNGITDDPNGPTAPPPEAEPPRRSRRSR